MKEHAEHFYAQSECSFLGLVDWAKEQGLQFHINRLEEPWNAQGVSCNWELIIEISLSNKTRLEALFLLVDKFGFRITLDFSSHFKEEKDGEKMASSEAKRNVA